MVSLKRWWSGVVVLLVAGVAPAVRAETSASPLADDPTLIALAVALSCSDAPEAIEAPPQGPAGPAAAGPEIELVATVRAKTLKFDEVPKVDVVFHGTGKRRTVWKTERVNLPVHPQPGVVYHDVQVRLTISSDVEELTSMLRQAKRAARGIRIEDVAAAAPAGGKVEETSKAAPAKPAAPAAAAAKPAPASAASAPPAAPSTATPSSSATPTPQPTPTTPTASPNPSSPTSTSPSTSTASPSPTSTPTSSATSPSTASLAKPAPSAAASATTAGSKPLSAAASAAR